jgi:hypothetical protein
MNSCMGNSDSNGDGHRQEQSSHDRRNYGAIESSSATSGDYHVIPSHGCWYGVFGTNQNLFCEVNMSGLKPNVEELAQYEPSCGFWAGTFCRQLVPKGKRSLLCIPTTNDNNNNNNTSGGAKPRSHCVCDGGGWFRSSQQRSSFQVVVQDEVITAASSSRNDKPQPKKGRMTMDKNGASADVSNSLVRNIRRSVF